jgi:hypothetical protein
MIDEALLTQLCKYFLPTRLFTLSSRLGCNNFCGSTDVLFTAPCRRGDITSEIESKRLAVLVMSVFARQWREPTVAENMITPTCAPYILPSGLIIPLGSSTTATLTEQTTVTPACYIQPPAATSSEESESISTDDLRDPFYSSTIPMAYSIAATTTLAYVLLLLLFMPNPPHSRPWLQKVATLTVCVCLTIAFVDTTDVLRSEYNLVGSAVSTTANEARLIRKRVLTGIVMKIGRIVSDLFLWLAQVQTLIRLFPREREKMVIKWAGSFLILLDTLFSILESFVSPLASTDSFLDAIPALSYLFQISLGMLYASCVLYYSFSKRRYSYFYPRRSLFGLSSPATHHLGGQSIILVAFLSIAAVVVPIVFFIVDIAHSDLAGWGDYVRWVGAAAASVVVWEWVDRIEGLEREENKGGVLGREIYDEDEDDRFVSQNNRISGGGGGGAQQNRRRRRYNNPDDPGGDLDLGRRSNTPNISPANGSMHDSGATTITSSSTSYSANINQLTETQSLALDTVQTSSNPCTGSVGESISVATGTISERMEQNTEISTNSAPSSISAAFGPASDHNEINTQRHASPTPTAISDPSSMSAIVQHPEQSPADRSLSLPSSTSSPSSALSTRVVSFLPKIWRRRSSPPTSHMIVEVGLDTRQQPSLQHSQQHMQYFQQQRQHRLPVMVIPPPPRGGRGRTLNEVERVWTVGDSHIA